MHIEKTWKDMDIERHREDMETYSYMLKKLKIYIYQERNTRNSIGFILTQEQRN